jgi:hypothetical protein
MRKIYSRYLLGILLALCAFTGYAQVSVTATGGTPGPTAYTTVKLAFDAINSGIHTGAITVSISANTTETAAAVLNFSGSGTASYTGVTIKPATGASPVVSGNINGPIIAILGSNVTIDGSNNASTSRNLTISNLDTSRLSAVSILTSGSTPNTNVTIKNSVIRNSVAGILLSYATAIGYGGMFTNITIQNNSIQQCTYGVFAIDTVGLAGIGTGLSITGNDLTATGAAAITDIGLYVQGFDGAVISGNNIGNFESSETGDDTGIWIASGSKNSVVEKNKINNLTHTGAQGYGGHGITISTGVTAANTRVSNNMISNMGGDGWDYTSQFAADNPIGIYVFGTQTGINVHFNTISMSGNTLNQTRAVSSGIYIATGTTATISNNIIVNNLGLAGTTGYGSVGIFAVTGVSQLAGNNYNDYIVSPTGSGVKFIGQIATTGSNTLAAWQTATGANANSVSIVPVFTSATDLHLIAASNTALDALGAPVAGITTDIDGETRSTTTPDMGADEFSTACVAPAITVQPVAQTSCSGTATTFSVTATGNNLNYQWRKGTVAIGGATSSTYVINLTAVGDAGSYDVVITNTCGNATSASVALTVNASPVITGQPVAVTVCQGNTANFSVTATGATGYQWRKGAGNIGGATSSSYSIPAAAAADAGSYSVVVSNATCSVTSNSVALVVSSGNNWIGVTSTDWNTASNWCGGIPTATSDVTISSGTAFAPVVSAISSARNLSIGTGASVTVAAGGRLNLSGNLVNQGTLTASATTATIAFQGTTPQNVDALTAANVIMNGVGGVVLTGQMVVTNTLTLTTGNISIGNFTLTVTGSAPGSVNSHVITNGLGNYQLMAAGTGPTIIPIAPDAAGYNPVTIGNGGGLNYVAKVSIGFNSLYPILNTARAINRQWSVLPSGLPSSNVSISLQYADADANAQATPAGVQETAVYNGSLWSISSGSGITPTGTAAARVVTFGTTQFGLMVVSSPGGFTYPLATPSVDTEITSVTMLPNLVEESSVLRVVSERASRTTWTIVDASGRVVMTLSRQLVTGRNDISLQLGRLAAGVYQVIGTTEKGRTQSVRFIKQ